MADQGYYFGRLQGKHVVNTMLTHSLASLKLRAHDLSSLCRFDHMVAERATTSVGFRASNHKVGESPAEGAKREMKPCSLSCIALASCS